MYLSLSLDSDDLPPEDDSDKTYGSRERALKTTDLDKACMVLGFMKENWPRFSLKDLLTVLFTSKDQRITVTANSYLATGGRLHLLHMIAGDEAPLDEPVTDWILSKAADLCDREASYLTENASRGPHFKEALHLRVPADSITVQHLQSFSLLKLLDIYEETTPGLQKLLKAVIKKQPDHSSNAKRSPRNPDIARVVITSMILNMRSRETNLHAAINSLVLWDGNVPRRVIQILNRFAFCASHKYQQKAIRNISKDAVQLARKTANDPEKLILLPNDNFNWVGKAWETSATHGNVTHDQVSALLVVLDIPSGMNAASLASVDSFNLTLGNRHKIPEEQSLEEILPTAGDQYIFENNAVIHVAHILAEEVKSLSIYHGEYKLSDPHALPIVKSEEYYLPTYDQEQGSTRGNMLVIGHYYGNILQVPKLTFESRYCFLLGDRLTTARERAAQDQRSVDRSEHRFDHLSSFQVLSGMMHFVLNQIQNIGKNTWGRGTADSVSLSTLLMKLPNRTNINLKKVDFYAWLRLFDVILRALVLRAAMIVLNLSSPTKLDETKLQPLEFKTLCSRIVSEFLMPSIDRLEAEDIKTIMGSTESGNAVLLMHDLMTVREMRHAIKHGHPERMHRMIKYWTPIDRHSCGAIQQDVEDDE
ncbi:hypothetical protein B0H13DRAFT_2226293 [Mycena leptocephala]|nr:hypothetical protein B0H13DRAFT_2226293 [Mycena leptocephala]